MNSTTKGPKMGEYKCDRCKSLFSARVADRNRGWARFCSKSCKAIKQERRTGQMKDYLMRRASAHRGGDDHFRVGDDTHPFSSDALGQW